MTDTISLSRYALVDGTPVRERVTWRAAGTGSIPVDDYRAVALPEAIVGAGSELALMAWVWESAESPLIDLSSYAGDLESGENIVCPVYWSYYDVQLRDGVELVTIEEYEAAVAAIPLYPEPVE